MRQKLQVPANISLRWELTPGFGTPELIRSSIVSTLVTAVALIYALLTGSNHLAVIVLVAVLMSFTVCLGFFSKMENNLSIYDYLILQKDFSSKQQKYYYVRQEEELHYVPNEETDR